MIETTYTLTEAEFVEAQQMLSRTVQKSMWRLRLFLCVILPLAVLSGALRSHFEWHQYLDGRMLFVATIFLIMISLPLQISRAARKQFSKVRDSFTNFRLRIDSTGYAGESPGIASGHIEWPGFTGWHEGKQVIVLARNNTMYPLPKRAFSAAQLDELRVLLKSRIKS